MRLIILGDSTSDFDLCRDHPHIVTKSCKLARDEMGA
jgi:hypothetical protein